MLYRILGRLDVGKGKVLEPGSFSRLEWLDEAGLQRLERKGSIGRVAPPPLAILPNWETRARRLEKAGYTDTEQFLEADSAHIAEAVGVKPPTVERWQEEVMGWLTADRQTG